MQSMGSVRPLQESWNGQWHGVTPVRPQRAGVCSVVPAHPGLLLTCRPEGASWGPVMGIEGVLTLCLLKPPVQEQRAGGSEVTKPPREPHDGLGATGLLGPVSDTEPQAGPSVDQACLNNCKNLCAGLVRAGGLFTLWKLLLRLDFILAETEPWDPRYANETPSGTCAWCFCVALIIKT